AIMSGSCMLHILLPVNKTPWVPTGLDIYVSYLALHQSISHDLCTGYDIVHHQTVHAGPYTSSSIHCVMLFSNNWQLIDVIVSSTVTAVLPIFKFHSTAVMNFITMDNIFCAYLSLTLKLMSMVNAGPLYFEAFGFKTMCTLKKYAAQHFLL
ncbi:hypothetical protein BKA82DRAFT_3954609, partial [Pisolithus tinctorius]